MLFNVLVVLLLRLDGSYIHQWNPAAIRPTRESIETFYRPCDSQSSELDRSFQAAFTHPLGGFCEVGVTGSIVLATYRIGNEVLYLVGCKKPIWRGKYVASRSHCQVQVDNVPEKARLSVVVRFTDLQRTLSAFVGHASPK